MRPKIKSGDMVEHLSGQSEVLDVFLAKTKRGATWFVTLRGHGCPVNASYAVKYKVTK